MNLDNLFSIIGIVTEAVLVGLLIHRRVWRTLPVFGIYCVWTLLSDVVAYTISHLQPSLYLTTYVVELAVGSALEFAVLIELAWSVLRPLRAAISHRPIIFVGALLLLVGAAIWPFVTAVGLASAAPQVRIMVHLQLTTAILRVLFFLVLAGFSQLLSIGWRDRELQIATGLGFFSIVSLGVEMMHTHQALGHQYSNLNRIVVAGYLCSLFYWVFSFAQKEAQRREFTPQMESFLLAVAGTARSHRISMARSSVSETPRRPKL